jgi:sarcosine/dimethylglycine N-methyltransferase
VDSELTARDLTARDPLALRQGDRERYDRALETARSAAYGAGEFVGQESLMTAREIRRIARAAGVGPRTRVLDLCCGVGGPGRYLARTLGCSYLGVDVSASAVAVARERAAGLPDCRFEVGEVPPVPRVGADVVLLLETLLAFADKEALLAAVSAALPPGGRFAFTVEEGRPLDDAERRSMPEPDTVRLTPLPELARLLGEFGLRVRWHRDWSRAHLRTVDALVAAVVADAAGVEAAVGPRALAELLTGHRLWSRWLRTGRVRKLALVVERA